MNGYTPKSLAFDKEAMDALVEGIEKIYKPVSSTMGPRGNTVIMESNTHTKGLTVTKDGVTVAKAIEVIDPVENLAVRVVREASEKTAIQAGDGTTTAIVLARNLIKNALFEISNDPTINPTLLVREMKVEVENVLKEIKKMSIKVTKGRYKDVASISANNDKKLGALIADVYREVGVDGVVTAEKSKTSETYSVVTKGMSLDKGLASAGFKNNADRTALELNDVQVLVSDIEISSPQQITNILEDVVSNQKSLLIIADCSPAVVSMLVANMSRNNTKIAVVAPPSAGFRRDDMLSDIAIATNSTYFSQEAGSDLTLATERDLGHAVSVRADEKGCVIITNPEIAEGPDYIDRLSELKAKLPEQTTLGMQKHYKNRIASLAGGIGVIYAGGDTDIEQKELFDRIDDAIQAVKSALEEGIVPGGGNALRSVFYNIYHSLPSMTPAQRVVSATILAPLYKILSNAGLETPVLVTGTQNHGLNVMTGENVDLIKDGVIDPAKVIRVALTNAMSVASTILTTNAVITLARSYETTK